MNKQTEFKLLGAGFFDSRYVFGNESGFVTKERCLSNYELEFFVENGGHLFVDGEVHEIVRGRALVGKPGQKRHSKLHFKAYYIHLKINDCYLRHFLDELPNIFEVHNDRVYEEIFLRITELNESDFTGKDLYIAAKIYELVSEMYRDANMAKIQMGELNDKKLEKARMFIEKNYNKPIKLKDISAFVDLSPVYFHKIFKKRYGESPNEYLQSLRLLKAKNFLVATDSTAEEIAFLCGFSSQSYFNYFFKQKVGMPPLQYRREVLGRYKI
ncbi:MAG: helix-turn-helix transcriptional regulator [Ruminococcaceae bacterium]|nr:helix-turn-helix transcriptional regulator [Oscillospiraceae bacterium]